MARRLDQYELNLLLLRRLCEQGGPLSKLVHIIERGMPPLPPAELTLS
jgi:hypothetical protein